MACETESFSELPFAKCSPQVTRAVYDRSDVNYLRRDAIKNSIAENKHLAQVVIIQFRNCSPNPRKDACRFDSFEHVAGDLCAVPWRVAREN